MQLNKKTFSIEKLICITKKACYTPVVQCRPPTSSHSHASVLRVARESCASAISPRYKRCCERHSISIYGIATDDYVSLKLLIVNVLFQLFCFELRRASHYCTTRGSLAGRTLASVN